MQIKTQLAQVNKKNTGGRFCFVHDQDSYLVVDYYYRKKEEATTYKNDQLN